ncbi:PREDICTED: uncharacterized protein LOC108355728 [Rhagoletis zephyria]|uniref:uncharacterized protein LOC108355728 n=1 Tax=Rhagoletis zephyria TaxID=28612 RepID=UPI0008114E09|nr:PREDICTED: uncharacterized protein LOC108355728 [Rhagoletis zephyria]
MQNNQANSANTGDGCSPAPSAGSEVFFEAIAPMPQQQATANIDRVERLELPPFWTKQVHLWFAAIAAQFQLKRITSDTTKYQAVIARLDQDTLVIVEHIIFNPPEADKYAALKEALVNHFSISEERRLEMLLSGLELGDRRPSELLAEINRLGGKHLDSTFVRAIWLDRLPQYIQVALTASDDNDNNQLVQLANKLIEIKHDPDSRYLMPIARRSSDAMQTQLDELAKKMRKLTQAMEKETVRRTHAPSGTSPTTYSSTCFYNRRFGAKANECTQPCTWGSIQGNAADSQ